jgi:hypothetical protein
LPLIRDHFAGTIDKHYFSVGRCLIVPFAMIDGVGGAALFLVK